MKKRFIFPVAAFVCALICLGGMIQVDKLTHQELIQTTGKQMNPALYVAAPGTAYHQGAVDTANGSGAGLYVAAPGTDYNRGAVETANAGNGGAVLGDSTTNYTAPVDPYAKWGGQTAYNNLVSGFADQKNNIYGSANDAATALQPGYAQSINDTIHNLTLGQQAIDRKNVQNESSKIQGGRDILSMIGRGIKSGGVMLANKNAGNSSAAAAIANAYGQLGQRQMSSVGNQYAQNAGDIAVNQQEQDYQQSQAPNKFHVDLMNNVNNIVGQARDKFAQLDAAMASASLPDRIAIEQEKENVRSQVLGQLQQYDAQLAQGVGGIHAASRDTNQATANSQLAAGQADPNLFQYTTQAPAQFQGQAPAGGDLPLFSAPRTKVFA